MGGGPEITERLLCILPFPEPKEILDNLRRSFPYIEVTYIQIQTHSNRSWKAAQEISDEVYHDKTILVTLLSLPSGPKACPNLKLIHFFSAGINYVVKHPIYTDTQITLTTSSGIHGPQIAEWVVMTYLVQSHAYNELYELQKKKQWAQAGKYPIQYRVRDLVRQRLGVLGYGSIGRQVGRVAKAMGMQVIAYTATSKDTPEKKKDPGFIIPGTGDPDGTIPEQWYSGLDKESLHTFLKQDIDVLVVSVPLTKDTLHMLSQPEFSILSRRHAFVSNISRGKIIDQPALVAALNDKSLRGAAVDVTDPEPLPQDDPLWDAPNATITPHISGQNEDYDERSFQVLELNLKRLERGERLINVVNRKRGY